ncbi:MAG: hypothetical protein KDD15_02895, partial [Lewinella sp.]|nr:hypothetical protein [Lewinella sp.]
MTDRIAILGDFNPAYYTLHALNDSTRAVQRYLGKEIQFDWIATDIFDGRQVFEKLEYKGLWIAPGSPYRDMANVLRAIHYARENRLPAFGNCGGFQHMVIEFARNVCGVTEAGHEEEFPGGRELVIRKLECSLKGEQEQVQIIDHSSLLFQTIGRRSLLGKYFCSYGLNEEYVPVLAANG